ncbi:hypothetical protein Ae201684P_017510 [Aphanomyces euteiches]|uniref:Uncharacterized protein n=1 Tax=Aphanomyces euteiches TaxID=100861 RepID=A0A6G0XMW8_9STRA|nr:hypothetical protein Ae201684_003317 [Aphanomyces euteiches]KAH9098294.1 hypothetical protein Ae201684P_017510 [Aphanomyces euteiches]KAH9155906.1 hypothetical protein AeRB84_002138 [Aphanomyces euteiches]
MQCQVAKRSRATPSPPRLGTTQPHMFDMNEPKDTVQTPIVVTATATASPEDTTAHLEESVLEAMEKTLLRCIQYVLSSIDPVQARNVAHCVLHVCRRLPVLSPLAQALETNANVQKLLQCSTETSTALPGHAVTASRWQWLWPFGSRTPVGSPLAPIHMSDGHPEETDGESSEIGWAVRYMQREAKLPQEVHRRMQYMMHTQVPLNLFRVEVEFASKDMDTMIGNVSPESFPPTPIGREFHTQRVTWYTVAVLDRANQALLHLHDHMQEAPPPHGH